MILKFLSIPELNFHESWKDGWDNCVRVKKIGSDFRVVKALKKPPKDVFQFIKRTCQ